MRFYRKDDLTGVVAAEGELTIYNAPELGSTLLEALESSGRVELDFRNVSAVDLPCLQLLWSAFLTSEQMKKAVVFDGGIPEAVEKAAKDAGYPDVSAGSGPARREE